jgi:hypothetical protein
MLSEEQKKEVAKWFVAGASLDEIQKRIKDEFSLHITYLDLRLMVSEFPQPVEEEEPETVEEEIPEACPAEEGEERMEIPAPAVGEEEELTPCDLDVSIDSLVIPGTLASGDVTFSDGVKGKWFVDQSGRLGLGGDISQGYRPPPTDAALFQQKLMELLQSRGLA